MLALGAIERYLIQSDVSVLRMGFIQRYQYVSTELLRRVAQILQSPRLCTIEATGAFGNAIGARYPSK
jgi:hypothetical protein